MDVSYKENQCKIEVTHAERFREEIPTIVDELVLTCGLEDCFDHVGPEPISSKNSIIELIEKADTLIVGPGSLFTSIMPHFLVEEVRKAVSKIPLKIYIMNITNDVAPVKNFKASDYVRTLEDIGGFVPDNVVIQSPSKGIEINMDGIMADMAQTDHLHCAEKLGGVLCRLLR